MNCDVHQQRQGLCCYVVGRDRMSLAISEIWIVLNFQQRLRKSSVWLVHPDQNCSIRKRARSDLKVSTFFRTGKFNAASRENSQQVITVLRRFNQIARKLTWPARAYRVLANRVETAQPCFAIHGGVVQQ